MATCSMWYGMSFLLAVVVVACSLGWVRGNAMKSELFSELTLCWKSEAGYLSLCSMRWHISLVSGDYFMTTRYLLTARGFYSILPFLK